MKEILDTDIGIKDEEETRQIQNVLAAARRLRGKSRVDLVYMFTTKQHTAIKIAEGQHQFTHLATAFASTEYDFQELPQAPLEIKVDSVELTDENISDSVAKFLKNHFPDFLNKPVNIYRNLKDYKTKQILKTLSPEAELAA